ncbi:hypothetical protein BBJ28_00006243 [Nothophytophthora sp. Chile5]|nr:hypothetical protein BBJ28_00006243 [Nothophytophthora sp. Chile5]
MSGIRMISSFSWFSDHVDDDDVEAEEENGHERLPPEQNLPMVPWYSMLLFDTVFELLISLKVFLGRFDQRTMQRALHPNDDDYCFDHLAEKDELWLDFMADCGDGFNSSYQIARLLAQPQLEVDCEADATFETAQQREKSRAEPRTYKRVFPRGEALVIGGDLAYPHPDSESYEKRLWRCFEYAMKAPRSYHPASISTKKKNPGGCATLRDYAGPSVFAIPGNHDWFDGLNTFTRYICQRDWLGGWLLPQKTSYFSLKLPHGWWLFGVDLALENDVDTEQFAFFERVVQSQMGPDDAVIVLTHEPRWLLDVYEDRSDVDVKLSHLLDTVLQGRVALRLAGDVHNYTRHTLVEETGVLKRSTSMRIDTSHPSNHDGSGLKPLPRRNSFASPVHKHFPHMHRTSSFDGVAAAASGQCGAGQGDQAKLSPPIRTRAAEHLIVSGGGGAFLHPTHAPTSETLVSNGGSYEHKMCYPPVHVSKYVMALLLEMLLPC